MTAIEQDLKLPFVRAEQTEHPGYHARHIIEDSSPSLAHQWPPSILPHQHPSSSLTCVQPHGRDTTAPSHPRTFRAVGWPTAYPAAPHPLRSSSPSRTSDSPVQHPRHRQQPAPSPAPSFTKGCTFHCSPARNKIFFFL